MSDTTSLECDYLLFIATETEEAELRTAAEERSLSFQECRGRWATYFDLGRPGMGSRVLAVRTAMGPLSHRGSASRAIHCKTETRATGIICLGMAFGVDPERQEIGDVLISTSVLPYDNRDILSESGEPREDFSRVRAHPAKRSLRNLLQREYDEGRDRSYAVYFGALLTGAARIHCRAYRNRLITRCSRGEPIIGGEMEAAGLLSVSDRKSPSWIVVKGICDFADEDRDHIIEETRPIACRHAAELVLDALINEVP